jgi:hypothetical protein
MTMPVVGGPGCFEAAAADLLVQRLAGRGLNDTAGKDLLPADGVHRSGSGNRGGRGGWRAAKSLLHATATWFPRKFVATHVDYRNRLPFMVRCSRA